MEIDKIIDKALSWICESKDFFNPLTDSTDMYAKKMFAELQLVLLIGKRNEEYLMPETIALMEKLETFSERIILSPEYYEQIGLNLRGFRMFAIPAIYYLAFKRNAKIEKMIERIYMQAFRISPEHLPYRLLDIEHSISLSERYTGTKIGRKIKEDVYATILNSHFDIINWDVEEEYALTHSIFYATDFGRNEIPDDLRNKAIKNIPVLCCQKVIEDDCDLLGEYIINMCNLKALREFRKEMYQILAGKQTPMGYFMGPRRKGTCKLDETVPDVLDRERNIVRNNYHTTLVVIMASILIKSTDA